MSGFDGNYGEFSGDKFCFILCMFTKDSLGEKVKIRLRGGRTKEEGRVEVKIGDNST